MQGLFKSVKAFLDNRGRAAEVFSVVPATYYVRSPPPRKAATVAGSKTSDNGEDDHGEDGEAGEVDGDGGVDGDSAGSDDEGGCAPHSTASASAIPAELAKDPGFSAFVDHYTALAAVVADRGSPATGAVDGDASERQCVKNFWIVKPAHMTNRGSVCCTMLGGGPQNVDDGMTRCWCMYACVVCGCVCVAVCVCVVVSPRRRCGGVLNQVWTPRIVATCSGGITFVASWSHHTRRQVHA